MDILLHSSTISVEAQVYYFLEGVTFIGASRTPVTTLLLEQVERLETVQKETTNAFRAAAIESLTEMYIEQTGLRPKYEVLNRLGNVMDADFIFAQYKEPAEYSSVTESQLKTRMSRESSAQSGYYTAADGQSYKPSTRYRGKSALD